MSESEAATTAHKRRAALDRIERLEAQRAEAQAEVDKAAKPFETAKKRYYAAGDRLGQVDMALREAEEELAALVSRASDDYSAVDA